MELGVVSKVMLDLAYLTHGMPTRRERGDVKPDTGQGQRYPGRERGILCRKNENLQLYRDFVSACLHWSAELPVMCQSLNREPRAKQFEDRRCAMYEAKKRVENSMFDVLRKKVCCNRQSVTAYSDNPHIRTVRYWSCFRPHDKMFFSFMTVPEKTVESSANPRRHASDTDVCIRWTSIEQ